MMNLDPTPQETTPPTNGAHDHTHADHIHAHADHSRTHQALSTEHTTLGVATGIDPLTDAINTINQLAATLATSVSSGSPLDPNATSIAAAQIRNVAVDLSLMQTQVANMVAQMQAAGLVPPPVGALTTPAAPANQDPNAPTQVTAAAAGMIALGALAVGGLGAWLIFGRKSGGGGGSRRSHGLGAPNRNPTEPPKRRRRRAR